jgi:IS30 family transposase
MGLVHTRVSREVSNNGGREGYDPGVAQRRAELRAKRPKATKLESNEALRTFVEERLQAFDSPEQISGRLEVEFPEDEEMRVSHETIYMELFVESRGALKKELTKCLRSGRATRKPRGRRKGKQGLKDIVSIAERPAEVDERVVPGHWEGDLITGSCNRSAIGTLVERVTGFVMLLPLPDGHRADQVQAAMVDQMSQLPEILRKTLTWDRGKEMANHVQIAEALDLDIYFADPYSPWQRGSNENTNGLLRQYFPKGTDLSVHSAERLAFVANQLNNRPRKRHGFLNPAEVLDRLLSEEQPHVAFTA